MLQDRDRQMCMLDSDRIGSVFMNSFFIDKLLVTDKVYTYKNVQRWTDRTNVDVFAKNKIFFPINISNTHWTLAVIYMLRKEIRYYDSYFVGGMEYLNALKRWLGDEWLDKKHTAFDSSGWTLIPCTRSLCSLQGNGKDCGMFATMNADFLSDDLDILQINDSLIPQFRRKMCLSITKGRLPYALI